MTKKIYVLLLGTALTIASTFMMVNVADATRTYLNQYNSAFGTSESCSLCHTTAPALNPTGQAFLDSGFNICSIGPAIGPCAPPPPPRGTTTGGPPQFFPPGAFYQRPTKIASSRILG